MGTFIQIYYVILFLSALAALLMVNNISKLSLEELIEFLCS